MSSGGNYGEQGYQAQYFQNRNAPSAHQQAIRPLGRGRGWFGVPPPNYQQNSANYMYAQMASQQQPPVNNMPGNNSQGGGGGQSWGSPGNNSNHGTPSPHNRDRSRSGDRSQSGNMGPPSQQVTEGSHNARDGRQQGQGQGARNFSPGQRNQGPGGRNHTPSPNRQNQSYGRGQNQSYGRGQTPTGNRQQQWDRGQQPGGSYTPRQQRHGGSDDIYLSKQLSSVLRHNAERFGFKLLTGGFLYVDELLSRVKYMHGFTIEDVKRIVKSNDKQRFSLEADQDGRLKIRANQGHSIEVECLDLKPITNPYEVSTVIHGTYWENWNIIKKTGLRRMKRNHIHFAAGLPGQSGVISGMRSSCEVIIYIDMKKALEAEIPFFRSANNVILSPGNKDGIIYPCFFEGVMDRVKKCKVQFDNTISAGVTEPASASGSDSSPDKKKKKKKKKRDRGNNPEEGADEAENGPANTGADGSQQNSNDKDAMDDSDDNVVFDENAGLPMEQESTTNTPDTAKGASPSAGAPGGVESGIAQGVKPADTNACQEVASSPAPTTGGVESGTAQVDVRVKPADTNACQEVESSPAPSSQKPEEVVDNWEQHDWNEPTKVSEIFIAQTIEDVVVSKTPTHMTVVTCGEGFGQEGSRVNVIIILHRPHIHVFHLPVDDDSIVKEGHLDKILTSKDFTKVFHNIQDVSLALLSQFDIVLEGSPIMDIQMLHDKCKLSAADKESLEENHGFSKTWFKEFSKDIKEFGPKIKTKLEDDVVTSLVNRGKLIHELYEICDKVLDNEAKRALKTDVYKSIKPKDAMKDLLAKFEKLNTERKEKEKAERKAVASNSKEKQQPKQQQQQQHQPNKGKGKKNKKK